MSENSITSVLRTTIEKVKEMVDANTIVGTPISVSDKTTIIPVSKITLGFASGGSDLPTKITKETFAGGGGAGITVSPVAFIVIEDGKARLMQLAHDGETVDRIVNMFPEVVDKVTSLIKKDKKD